MGRGFLSPSLSASFSLFLPRRRFLLCNLLAATSPRSSLPLTVSARGQRAHAPPSAYTLVPRRKKEEEVVPREMLPPRFA